MRDPIRRRRQAIAKALRAPQQDIQLDLVALTLAIWLAVIVMVTGFVRLSADARAAVQQAGHVQATPAATAFLAATP